MNTLKEFIRVVNERDALREQIDRLNEDIKGEKVLLQRVLAFGETVDPEFRTKCLGHLDNEDANDGPFGVWKIMNRDLWKRLGLESPAFKTFSYVGSPKADDGV